MRKLFILIIFISSLMVSSMAHAEWTKVSTHSTGDVLYVDFSSIWRKGDKAYFWIINDYLKPTPWGHSSSLSYREVDCKRFTWRYLELQLYRSSMALGQPDSTEDVGIRVNWAPHLPFIETALILVCRHRA